MLGAMSLHFEPEAHIRDFIGFRWKEVERELRDLLPEAQLEHVGSSAVYGAWTNGDVDIQVRVAADKFSEAEKALAGTYQKVEKSGKTYAVYAHEGRGVRLHLTAIDSERDVMVKQRELLKGHALLRERYDAIKRRHQNGDPEAYQKAKDEFWKQAG
jgi:GrpB-like predicted nucleotidyltransferase (UPF0157 family)